VFIKLGETLYNVDRIEVVHLDGSHVSFEIGGEAHHFEDEDADALRAFFYASPEPQHVPTVRDLTPAKSPA
jgi:uncharacterized cupin superfamily protein